jgi:phenylpropionate dioxygenase-like ring-hydroxylating dioxygenase large terminal subunit
MNNTHSDHSHAKIVARGAEQDWVPGKTPMRDTWIPIAHSVHITNKVTWRPLYSKPYFLWREGGQLQAADHHPAARQPRIAPADEFTGGTGRYPVTERYGFVWVWYGNPDNARLSLLPNMPHLPVDGRLPGYMRGQTRLHCCSELSMENLMDLTHADFVHSDLLGDAITDDDTITVESTSETITMVRTSFNKTAAPIQQKAAGIKTDKQNVRFAVHIYVRSHVAAIYSRFEPGLEVRMVHCGVPETCSSNRVQFIQNTMQARRPYRYIFPLASYKIAAQDDAMLMPQESNYHRKIARRDYHSRFDTASIRYRALVQEILDRQSRGDYSYESDELISGDKTRELGVGIPITRSSSAV